MVLIQLMCPSASWAGMAAWYFDERAPRMDMMEALCRAKLMIQWIVLLYSVLLFSLIMAASLL